MDDRKSTTRVIFSLGSGMITCMSKKQKVIELSITEAKYIAMSSTACQCLWLRKLMKDSGLDTSSATFIWCDNKSTIAIAKNPEHHGD